MKEIKFGLWERKSKKTGITYYTGKVGINGADYYITMFDKNINKKNPKAPDYNLILKPVEQEEKDVLDDGGDIPF